MSTWIRVVGNDTSNPKILKCLLALRRNSAQVHFSSLQELVRCLLALRVARETKNNGAFPPHAFLKS